MTLNVEYAPAAEDDLRSIFNWIDDTDTAIAYVTRIRAQCDRLGEFPHRGSPQERIARGLRTISFERRATIAYMVRPTKVRILRVLHHGRDLPTAFDA